MIHSDIEKQKINDTDLFYSISKHQDSSKPIILYLHGGPGDSCIPLTQKFNSELEKDFIFVNVEQRGAGLSYYKFPEASQLSMATLVQDIHLFINYLLERFKQKQVILLGHSWGTVLAIKLIQAYPELILKYIGIGQVVDMRKNIEYQQLFLTDKGANTADLDFEDENLLIQNSLKLTKQIVKNGGSLYNQTNYRKLIIPFLFSKTYSLKFLFYRIKGSNQAIQFFWKELMEVSFDKVDNFPIPVYFIEGRHDYHVSAELVKAYSKKIKSPNSIIWFENSGHFPQWEEPEKFNQTVSQLCKEAVF